jgi:hypothetical protein
MAVKMQQMFYPRENLGCFFAALILKPYTGDQD